MNHGSHSSLIEEQNHLLHLIDMGILSQDQNTLPANAENGYIFYLIEEGKATFLDGGKAETLGARHCLWLSAQQSYELYAKEGDEFCAKWVCFDGAQARSLFQYFTEKGGKSPFILENPLSLNRYFDRLDQISRIGGGNEEKGLVAYATLLGLLTDVICQPPQNDGKRKVMRNRPEDLRAYLDAHYNEKITLEDMAKEFSVNKFYLTRIFKENYNCSIVSYLNAKRIEQAKYLLRSTSKTAEEIARLCGIPDACYFHRVFQKSEGVNPGTYRKQWSEN
ncbi:MAG: helix-turn-helix domain-containing protein [Clostridia bacterium]|nr:helix-turn-helix domain-containing protein [Clostridia bacterium]